MECLMGTELNSDCWLEFVWLSISSSTCITRQEKIVALELIGATFFVQEMTHEFIYYDDPGSNNAEIKAISQNLYQAGIQCWKEAMALRNIEPAFPKIADLFPDDDTFNNTTELMSMEDLDLFQRKCLPMTSSLPNSAGKIVPSSANIFCIVKSYIDTLKLVVYFRLNLRQGIPSLLYLALEGPEILNYWGYQRPFTSAHMDIVRWFLEAGANPNISICQYGNINIPNLLDVGTHLNKVMPNGETIFEYLKKQLFKRFVTSVLESFDFMTFRLKINFRLDSSSSFVIAPPSWASIHRFLILDYSLKSTMTSSGGGRTLSDVYLRPEKLINFQKLFNTLTTYKSSDSNTEREKKSVQLERLELELFSNLGLKLHKPFPFLPFEKSMMAALGL
uniref:Uncharacterized protein n=1 Tax=Daphnia galeata TaxID=27404 RepID=A0A8J2RVK7_9CRUS|nr:unnamed protein product [Daphnia galeata]